MRRVLSFVLLLFFVLGLAGVSFANVKVWKKDLAKVRAYLDTLDAKIAKAREVKDVAKSNILKELKVNALARAKSLKAAINQANYKAPKRMQGWRLAGGYGGGAGLVRLGYLFPVKKANIIVDLGYALGNQYNISLGGLSFFFPQGPDRYLTLDVLSANYSQTVAEILGLSQISQGSNTGFGLSYGFPFKAFTGQVGYNTALGVTLSLVRQF